MIIWEKFSECDWTEIPQIFILTIIYLISRIPFLNLGFGVDPDAWRIANSAFDLNNFLIYNTSRFPGYPLPEYANSLLINYGWVATNSLTMIISLIAILMFAKILKEIEVENKGLIIITFAFMPLIWINSVNAMDYMWNVTFIILSWYFIIKNHHLLAGLMMGLAIASAHISNIADTIFVPLFAEKIKRNIFLDCSITDCYYLIFTINYAMDLISSLLSESCEMEYGDNEINLLDRVIGTCILVV